MRRDAWVRGGQHALLRSANIWYRVDGPADAPTLLFAHGFPTSSHDWTEVVARLEGRFRCVTFDFLGFGSSSKPRRVYSYALQHEAVRLVVAAARVSRAVLVAHDYAVTIAQDFLANAPPPPFTLDGVVFLNGALDPSLHRPRPVQRLLATRLGGVVGPLLLGRRALRRALEEVVVRRERLPFDDIWASIEENDGFAVLPRLLHYMPERRLRQRALVESLRQARVPIAFAFGLDDPISGAHVLEAAQALAPAAAVCALRGVGHYPHLEAPDEVAAFIARSKP